jgi:hypothetical protein
MKSKLIKKTLIIGLGLFLAAAVVKTMEPVALGQTSVGAPIELALAK